MTGRPAAVAPASAPPAVGRAWRVVTVTGPESTGKSTLAAALAGTFGGARSEEGSRRYVERRLALGLPPERALSADHVGPIALAQVDGEVQAERAAAARGLPLVVRDTDLVSTLVYAAHYYGERPDWLRALAHARRADLYLLCAPDVPWVADPARDRPHQREALHDDFAAALAALDCRVVPVRGDWAEREAIAAAAVRALLADG